MSLNRFRGQIQSRIRLLDMLIKKKEHALERLPSGNIIIYHNACQGIQYYKIDPKTGTRTYIPKANVELIKALAQKNYDARVLKSALKEKELLEKLMNRYPTVTMEEYYETLDEERRKLVSPVWLPDEEFIKRWQEAPFKQKRCVDKEQCFLTNRGEYVKSKSEKIIADRLNERNIPYRYEAELVLDEGVIIHPDFTLINMKTRNEVYLEHLGMMDNPGYANKAVKRIRLYSRNGIVLGDRLWITLESEQVPLDLSVVDAVVDRALNRQ